jgi:hypothetical protein
MAKIILPIIGATIKTAEISPVHVAPGLAGASGDEHLPRVLINMTGWRIHVIECEAGEQQAHAIKSALDAAMGATPLIVPGQG